MNGYIEDSDPPEVILLQQGASCDVISDNQYKLPLSFKNEILEKYPRNQFNKEFIKLINLERKMFRVHEQAYYMTLDYPS